MKKLAAFAAAFLLALTVALVPLAVSELGRPGAQPSVEAQQAGPLPPDIETESPVYEYFVWPGIQEEVTDAYLHLSWKDSGGSIHVVENDDGGGWKNSRIYEPLVGGRRHFIEATTFAPEKTGAFEITICRSFYEQHGERVCSEPITDLATEECTTDLDMISGNVRVKGSWTERCLSAARPGSYARSYTFAWRALSNVDTAIDLRGQPDMVRNPRKLRMTCGWHKVCDGNIVDHSKQTGIDIGKTGDGRMGGEPVFFSVSNSIGNVSIKARPEFITDPNNSCKKVLIDITLESNTTILWQLRYTHVVIPKFLEGTPLPDIPLSSADGIFTTRRIGQVAYAPLGGQVSPLYDNVEDCKNLGDHLHQGYSAGDNSDDDSEETETRNIAFGMTRNIDPDTDRTDLCVTHSIDDRGLPTRKPWCNGEIHGRNSDDGVAVRRFGPKKKELTDNGCFWSDTWVLAFGNTSPGPTDRAVYGPNRYQIGKYVSPSRDSLYEGDPQQDSYCPLRFIPNAFADQSWVYGREISLQLPAARGGNGTISYGIDCAGLSFDAPTLTLSGIPDAAGSGECTLRATDVLEATKGDWPGGAKAAELTAALTFSYDMVDSGAFPISHSGPPPTGLRLGAGSDRLNLSFVSARATEFELYREESGGFCAAGAAGCSADGEASAPAAAAAARTASFEKQPSGVYRARGRSCSGGPSGVSGAGGAEGAGAGTVCGPWGAWSPEFTHRVPSFGDNAVISGQTWIKGRAVSLTLPAAAGGDGTLRYSLSTPPGGTTLDAASRVVSGVPAATQAAETYTWTAADADGDKASLTFTIAVNAAAPTPGSTDSAPSFGDKTVSGQTWTKGTAVSLTLPAADGGNGPLIYTLSPSLPPGVTRTGFTVSGTPSATKTRTKYTWTATDADSDKDSETFYITVNSPPTPTPTPEPEKPYTLTVVADPASCGEAGGSGTYDEDEKADVSVRWNAGCRFTGWSSGVTGVNTNTSSRTSSGKFTVNSTTTVTASFTKIKYTLTVNVSPTGAGSVSRSSDAPYYRSDSVTLTARANSGYRFSGWSGDGTGTGKRTVTMNGNREVTAEFSAIPTECPAGVFVNFEVGRSGSATLPAASGGGGGIAYSRGSMPDWLGFNSSTRVVSATPAKAGTWLFSVVATGSNGSSASCLHAVTASKIPYALEVKVTETSLGNAHGSVSRSPAGPYYYGNAVTLTASANPGYRFVKWSGDASGTSATVTLTMKEDKAVKAHFELIPYTLGVTVTKTSLGNAHGSVSRSRAGPYYYGNRVTLTANANPGYRFVKWSGHASGTSARTAVTINGNKSVKAHFELIPLAPCDPGVPGSCACPPGVVCGNADGEDG